MKSCPKCKNSYEDNMNFCPLDGTKLIAEVVAKEKVCNNCKSENPPEARFCYNCGTQFDESQIIVESTISKNEKTDIQLSAEAERLLSILFPLFGIIPGQTTLSELREQNIITYTPSPTINCNSFSLVLTFSKVKGLQEASSGDRKVVAVEVFPNPSLPQNWLDYGFQPIMSFADAHKFLSSNGFEVKVIYNYIQKNMFANNTFIGQLSAKNPDGSITITMSYHNNKYNHTSLDTSNMLNNTLVSVKVAINEQ